MNLSKPILDQWFKEGIDHLMAGRWAEAESTYGRILTGRPDMAEAHLNLGMALVQQRKFKKAEQCYRRAVALAPNFADAWNNLGNCLRDNYQVEKAIACYRRAVKERPGYARGLDNLAAALSEVGQLDESLATFDLALAAQSNQPATHSRRLWSLHFHPRYGPAEIFAEARQWNDRFAAPLVSEIPIHDNDPAPQRRLRIGYVSPDFRQHCQSLFTLPLLVHHDHRHFEIFCYSNVSKPDAVTTRLQSRADAWRDIARVPDPAAAELIRKDRIDILVDLALHTANNRLCIFARKPAPVQVTWLGYPGTTGMEAIDYRLTDPQLDPVESEIRNPKSEIRINDQNPNDQNPNNANSHNTAPTQPWPLPHSNIGSLGFDSDFGFAPPPKGISEARISEFSTQEPYYSERSVRLPDTFWCYDPRGMEETPDAVLPLPGPLPVLKTKHLTFGCLNNFYKITQPTLELWARVLSAVPDSQLLVVAPQGDCRDRVVKMLGVKPHRVSFVAYQPRKEYLQTFRRVDICLDTVPYNGGTTSLESLWMGVPVLTIVGQTVAGRAGWSLMHNLGLPELVAHTEDNFVQIAAELAGDLKRLQELRTTLRSRMEQSPLMDGARFARNVESAYRQMWRIWCRRGGQT